MTPRSTVPPATISLVNAAQAEMQTLATILGRSWAMPEMLPRAEAAADALIARAREIKMHARQLQAEARREARTLQSSDRRSA